MLATVRNKQGAIIRDLGKDDFTVLENGRPQTIKYFSRDTTFRSPSASWSIPAPVRPK